MQQYCSWKGQRAQDDPESYSLLQATVLSEVNEYGVLLG